VRRARGLPLLFTLIAGGKVSTLIGQGPLVVVAFGEVQYLPGGVFSVALNSGVDIRHVGTGIHDIVLPEGLGQEEGSFLFLATPKQVGSVAVRAIVVSYFYTEATRTIEVSTYNAQAESFDDVAFDFVVLRPTYPDAVED